MNKVFKSKKLSFLELRYVHEFSGCEKMHHHEELTLVAIDSGLIYINFQDKNTNLKANELSVINPREAHYAQSSDVQSQGCYVLYLNKKWCQNIQNELFGNKNTYIDISTSLIRNKELCNTFILMCQSILSSYCSLIEKEEKLILFMSKFFINYCSHPVFDQKSNKNQKVVQDIKTFLDKNFQEDITLEDISSITKLSVVHILRIFKKEFGLPIHSYILNRKVHYAKELLSENIPIIEVALSSGFFDQSHLNKSFKRVFQLTPKEYQKNILS